MDSGLLRANNRHYQYPQIFEVSSVNMEFTANSFWKQLRSQIKKLPRENAQLFQHDLRHLLSEVRKGGPKSEEQILLK